MIKFAIFSFLFRQIEKEADGHYPMYPDMEEAKEEERLYAWEHREELLSDFMGNDLMPFTVIRGTQKIDYKKKAYKCHLNHNVFVFRLANKKHESFELNFNIDKREITPSSFVFFDNREGVRRVAIQMKSRSFSSPFQAAKIIENGINYQFRKYGFRIELNAMMKTQDFWDNTKKYEGKLKSIEGETVSQYITDASADNVLGSSFRELGEVCNKIHADFIWKFRVREGLVMHVCEEYSYIKKLVHFCSIHGCPLKIRTIDNHTISCFVKDASLDNLIIELFDRKTLKKFDDRQLEAFDTPMQKIIEFLNSLTKYAQIQ